MSESDRRDGSRLEVDDGEHCKVCGDELPGDLTDADGCRIIWSSQTAEINRIEKCPTCWAEERIRQLRTECMDRFDGALPAVLDIPVCRPRYSNNNVVRGGRP